MFAPQRDTVDSAHEQVFGHRPARSTAAADAAPASQRPQPPLTAPPLRSRPKSHPVPSSGLALVPRQPAGRQRLLAGTLSHRQAPRKRIILSSRGSGTECTADLVRQQYHGAAYADPGPRAPLDSKCYSPPIPTSSRTSLCANALTTLAQAELSEPALSPTFPVVTSLPRTNPYYCHVPKLPPSARRQADADAAPMPPPEPVRDAFESSPRNARATSQPQMTNSPSLRTDPSVGTAAGSMVSATATLHRSGSAGVFERLAGESRIGVTMLGKRVRQWAEGAGLVLHPSSSAWHALLAYSTEPLRHERLWRQTCAKGRYRLSLLARAKAGDTTHFANTVQEHKAAHRPSHADPRQEAMAHGQRGPARRRSLPSATPGGLSAYRRQQEYTLWCRWQLWHFFEQGRRYLTSVWRVSPPLDCQRRHAVRCCGNIECRTTSPASSMSRIFDGRYVVPSAASIDAAQEEHRALEKRVNVLLRLLRQENGPSAPTFAERSGNHEGAVNGAGMAACGAGAMAGSTVLDPDEEGAEDEERANVYHSVSQSRRISEAVAATQPYLDVRVDNTTGLMHLSLYVNGDAGGNGAEFVDNSVAGCIDNHRWVILKGLWALQVLVFCFHREEELPSSTEKHADEYLKRQGGYDEQTEQDASRRSQIVDGLVVKGVAFAKVKTGHTLATAQDTFACTRCGQTRRLHNEVYISKKTGRIVCGMYYCVVCLARTHHVRLPPMKDIPPGLLGEREASVADVSWLHTVRDVSPARCSASLSRFANTGLSDLLPSAYAHQCSMSSARAADAPQLPDEAAATAMREWTRAAAAAPPPEWHPGGKVDSDELFGGTRGLDCPPPRPRM
ncbi:hypothetical protein CGC21_35740 [Leishmania donovani]|uniref:Uncharacterized protein n=2 Tax=Leishmania donovani TaxID=5661 RepID=A0A504XLB2_LEIDO|nr:hypothetical protein CGC21_35740 [Leishmania donovani]